MLFVVVYVVSNGELHPIMDYLLRRKDLIEKFYGPSALLQNILHRASVLDLLLKVSVFKYQLKFED